MTKRKNASKTARTAADVMAEAQAITVTGPIDHVSQISSWTPPAVETDEDPALIEAVVTELTADEAPTTLILGDTMIIVDIETSATEAVDDDEHAVGHRVIEDPIEEIVTFASALAALDPEMVDEMVVEIADQLDDRVAYENQENPDNESIQKTLKKIRAQFTASKNAARVLLVTNTTTDFINRSVNQGSRYNVYALGKIADLVAGLTEGAISNAVNNACIRSLFNLKAAGVPFTGAVAKAATSDKIRTIDPLVARHLFRHNVAVGTASTQASSTMSALRILGIVSMAGTTRSAVYSLNDCLATTKLADKMGIEQQAA